MGSSRKFFFAFLFSTYGLTLSVAQLDAKPCSPGQDTYCWVWCVDNSSSTTPSTYQTNLNSLFSSFTSDSTNNYGFYNVTKGQNPDQVYAVALCRGDLNSNPDGCLNCINDATPELGESCPGQKEAIVWSEKCMFRYANYSIIGVVDSRSYYYYHDTPVANVPAFNDVLAPLLGSLISKAAAGDSHLKFATGEANVSNLQSIYALMQCTPDLSKDQCNSCLIAAKGKITDCCDGRSGVTIFGGSCYLRFEKSPFYNVTAVGQAPPAPPPSPPPPNGISGSTVIPKYHSTQIFPLMEDLSNFAGDRVIIIIVVSIVCFLIVSSSIFILFRIRKSKKRTQLKEKIEDEDEDEDEEEDNSAQNLQFDFNTIRIATDNFSDMNKLGQGGFGVVYKGKLEGGKNIAVKRLLTDSTQGGQQFENEVRLLAKLQHRNLVRLLGFCLHGNERLLILEFVPNSSLDHCIFHPIKRLQLGWDRRYKIIVGIAKGILYLHEDSQYRIIHRDLKAANILLDAEMNPKISDFGLARLFENNQSKADTINVVGTLGYIAPEYMRNGHFSVKSDVYSFGVLVLEIISGQKIQSYNEENGEDILTLAWKHWMDGTALDFIDPILRGGSSAEMMRCIHIGLLCVQESVAKRPTMAFIVLMLSSSSGSLPVPPKPAYYMHSEVEPEPARFTTNNASISTLDPR